LFHLRLLTVAPEADGVCFVTWIPFLWLTPVVFFDIVDTPFNLGYLNRTPGDLWTFPLDCSLRQYLVGLWVLALIVSKEGVAVIGHELGAVYITNDRLLINGDIPTVKTVSPVYVNNAVVVRQAKPRRCNHWHGRSASGRSTRGQSDVFFLLCLDFIRDYLIVITWFLCIMYDLYNK
jgi:hypothetical protein